MLDKAKVILVSAGLLEINKVYKRPRFIFTRKKAQFGHLIEGSTFVGNFRQDDLSLVEIIKAYLKQGYYVLAIAEEEDVNVYRA